MAVNSPSSNGFEDRVHIHNIETVVDDWYTLQKYTFDYRRNDGTSMRFARHVCGRGDRAAVLPYHRTRNSILLTRQFRLPALVGGHPDGMILEVPGGLLDGQRPEDAARRELEEEIGLRVRHVEEILLTFLNPLLMAERVHLFVAEIDNAEPAGTDVVADPTEDIDIVELPLDEALSLVQQRQIIDAKTILLLLAITWKVNADQHNRRA